MIASLVLATIAFAGFSPERAQTAAVGASPDVAGARARVEQNAAQLAVSRDLLFPSFAANYAQVPQGNPPGPQIISRLVTVGLQTTITDFLAYGQSVRAGVLALTAARADADVAVRGERIKTIGLYYDALKARAIAEARDRALALAVTSRDAAQTRLRAGDAPRLDLLRAEVAVSRATADAEAAHAADANATEALRIETALPPDVPLQPANVSDPPPAPLDAAAATTTALGARAEIASALASFNAAQATRLASLRSGFPGIIVTAGETTGTDSGVSVGAPSITAQLTLPIGPVSHDRVRIEEGRIAEAQARLASARRTVALEVSAAARTSDALQRAAIAAARARTEAQAELTATELGYRNGATSSLELATARDTYTQALVAELSARYDAAKAAASFGLQIGR